MSLLDTLRSGVWNFMLGGDVASLSAEQRARLDEYARLRAYQRGQHKRQITVKPLQADDNIVVNFCGLIVERGISFLFGQGIDFDLPGETESESERLIKATWAANRQGILLHKLAQLGGVYGTCYVKLLPGGRETRDGQPALRLVPLLPWSMRVVCEPHDMERVLRYEQTYTTGQGREADAHRIVTERVLAVELQESGGLVPTSEIAGWTETRYLASQATGGRWVEQAVVDWPYPFAPIVHWQNLPDAESPYGLSDLTDLLELQDRYNFLQSNNSKIVRYHAHPKTWMRGQRTSNASWGPDEMVVLQGQDAMVANLEMQSDLASARALALDLRQALFDLARTVDTQSLADKLGALTNFGLRVLYKDQLDKNHTKRLLYGDGLGEINRRLLLLAGQSGEAADPGEIVWPEPLPVDDLTETAALTQDINNGLVSKQTASGIRGYDWETELERLAQQASSSDSVGAALLRAFGQGQGV